MMNKVFFLVGTLLSGMIILIVAFENINSTLGDFLLFFIPWSDPFFFVITVTLLGFMAGLFLVLFIVQSMKKDEEDTGSEALQNFPPKS